MVVVYGWPKGRLPLTARHGPAFIAILFTENSQPRDTFVSVCRRERRSTRGAGIGPREGKRKGGEKEGRGKHVVG